MIKYLTGIRISPYTATKAYTLLLLLLLTQQTICSQPTNANERLKAFINNITVFNHYFPQEKVYLHFDNTGYFRGERIWFKAYVTRADNNRRTDMSRVLYVELLNPIGDVVETCKLKINEGQADGSIRLDSILNSGFYEVRAYTRDRKSVV